MLSSFATAGAREGKSPADPRFDALRGKLVVDRPEQWEEATGGMDPAEFYEMWTRDLPGDVTIFLKLTGGGQGNVRVSSYKNGKEIFWAERNFNRRLGTMELEKVRIEDSGLRRNGIGKALLENQINVAETWGIKKIHLRAGDDDGIYFWSRRGAYVERTTACEERQPLTYFRQEAEAGLAALKDVLPADFAAAVRKSLARDGSRTNCVIARLPGEAEGVPFALKLFKCINPFYVYFDLEDKAQMRELRESLGDMDRLRANLRALEIQPEQRFKPFYG